MKREGLISYLFGCHQFFLHPFFVLIAWRQRFGFWPKPWEAVCIFLHDIGIVGKNYLSDHKAGHWKLGARLARRLFGMKGWDLCAGHTTESGRPLSKLFWADKGSRLLEPELLQWCHYFVERFGVHQAAKPKQWKAAVRRNLERDDPLGSHDLFKRRYSF